MSASGCIASTNTAPYKLGGTWVSSGNVSIASYNLTLECNGDGTAELTGLVSLTSISKKIDQDLKWAYEQDNTFLLSSENSSISVIMNVDTISLTINPEKMGVANVDIDYELTMTRSPTSPDALIGLWNGTIEGNVSNEVMLDFLKDGNGSISVIYSLDGVEKQELKNMTWEYVDANEYQAVYDSNTAFLELFGDRLTITLIPSEFMSGASNTPVTILTEPFIVPTPIIESPV
ncbi:hypothetical protein [uncultured Methanocorpusculum sp.]|nr:hypothetical protein [uncultured Methanocorpusculum sp.]